LIFKEPLQTHRAIGILHSLCGAILVITRGDPMIIFAGGIGRGELLIFGCVLAWTLYSVFGKTAMKILTPSRLLAGRL